MIQYQEKKQESFLSSKRKGFSRLQGPELAIASQVLSVFDKQKKKLTVYQTLNILKALFEEFSQELIHKGFVLTKKKEEKQ